MDGLVDRLRNLIEVSEVDCERNLYIECADRIKVLEEVLSNTIALLNGETDRIEKMDNLVAEGRKDAEYLASPLRGLEGCAETINALCSRIEALEKEVEEWAGGAADSALRVVILEKALREIAAFHGPIPDIARAALKEVE